MEKTVRQVNLDTTFLFWILDCGFWIEIYLVRQRRLVRGDDIWHDEES